LDSEIFYHQVFQKEVAFPQVKQCGDTYWDEPTRRSLLYIFSLYFWKRWRHADLRSQDNLRGFSDYYEYIPLYVRIHTQSFVSRSQAFCDIASCGLINRAGMWSLHH